MGRVFQNQLLNFLESGHIKVDQIKRQADEAIKSERCAIPRQIHNEISTIASASKKTNCEVQIEVLREWTELKKLQNECTQSQAQGIRDDRCKYVNPK